MSGKPTHTATSWTLSADLMTANPFTTDPSQSLSHLVNRVFLKHGISFAPVVENGVLLGYVDFPMVRKIDREHWTTTTVEDVIEPTSDENTVCSKTAALAVLSRILTTGRRKFLVADDNVLIGVITLSDVLKVLHEISPNALQEDGTFGQDMK